MADEIEEFLRRAAMRRARAGVHHDSNTQDCGEKQQRCADAVDAELPPDPKRGQPRLVQDGTRDHRCDDEGCRGHAGGQAAMARWRMLSAASGTIDGSVAS